MQLDEFLYQRLVTFLQWVYWCIGSTTVDTPNDKTTRQIPKSREFIILIILLLFLLVVHFVIWIYSSQAY